MTESDSWNESSSELFLTQGDAFVPDRSTQFAILLQLLPAQVDDVFTVVELGAGGGILAGQILNTFPSCHYIALDGSEVMREQMRRSLASFGERIEIRPFDLADQQWRLALPTSIRCILSSLCVHHLNDEGKQRLFNDLVPKLEPGGALLLSDLVRPANDRVARLFAQQYDDLVRARSLKRHGDLRDFEHFNETQWNYFTYDYGQAVETIDFPSRLSDQLRWLGTAGLSLVDSFWMRAGHAIYGGYR